MKRRGKKSPTTEFENSRDTSCMQCVQPLRVSHISYCTSQTRIYSTSTVSESKDEIRNALDTVRRPVYNY